MLIDERQRRVAEAIEPRSHHLAGAYRRGVEEFDRQSSSGDEAARVLLICHCMREAMNGLPAAMAEQFIPRPDSSIESLVEKVRAQAVRAGGVDLSADFDLVPVPRSLARAVTS